MPYVAPAVFNVLPGSYSVFVTQGSPGGLPIPDASYVGSYARVSDLFGAGVTDLMLCISYVISGITYYRWRPLRDEWPNVGTMPVASTLSLVPLQTPSVIRLTGTMASNMVITPSTVNAYPGLTYELRYDGLLSVLGISLSGVLGASAIASGQNKVVYFDGTQFIQKAG